MTIKFTKEKATKNTIKFTEVQPDPNTRPTIGTLYVLQSAIGDATEIEVAVTKVK